MRTSIQKVGLIGAIVLVLTAFAPAANTFWDVSSGGWSISGNWDNGEPGTNDYALIDNGGTAQITQSGEECLGLYLGYFAYHSGTVDMDGGSLTSSDIWIGYSGTGTINMANGGKVTSNWGNIGSLLGSTGKVTVDGTGSVWTNNNDLYAGQSGGGTLEITNSGLVSVAGTLIIDYNGGNDSFVNMSTGGMLALYGKADDSIADFLDLVSGSDAIRYWDGSSWADITGATPGEDYTLTYLTGGDLAGYTMLTVPEPTTMGLLGIGGLAMLRRRRK